jgi:tetratricopeptide (TPR) repeat protein
VAVAAAFAFAGEKLRFGGSRASGRIVLTAAAVYVVFLGLSAVDRNRDWRDDHTLFTNDVLGTPNYREGLTWLGRTYLDRGKPLLAAQSLEMAAVEDPEFTSYVNYRGLLDASGRALMAMERYDEAAAAFRKLVEIDPGEPLAHMNLGTALAGAGRLEEALQSYAEAERLEPRNALVYFNRGFALFKAGESGAARADLERAIELDPQHTNALNLLGFILLNGGDAAGAARFWRRSLEIKPGQERIIEMLRQAEAASGPFDNR